MAKNPTKTYMKFSDTSKFIKNAVMGAVAIVAAAAREGFDL